MQGKRRLNLLPHSRIHGGINAAENSLLQLILLSCGHWADGEAASQAGVTQNDEEPFFFFL